MGVKITLSTGVDVVSREDSFDEVAAALDEALRRNTLVEIHAVVGGRKMINPLHVVEIAPDG